MYQKCQKKGKTLRKVKAAAAQATAWPAGERRQEASHRPQGQGGHLPLAPHVEAAGGSQQEFPAPPGRAWHSATPRHVEGLGGQSQPQPPAWQGKEGWTVDGEAAVHSPPGNAGAKPGGWGWGRRCRSGTLSRRSPRWWLSSRAAPSAVCCGRDAQPCSEDVMHSGGTFIRKDPLPRKKRGCLLDWTCAWVLLTVQPHREGYKVSWALFVFSLKCETWSLHATLKMQQGASSPVDRSGFFMMLAWGRHRNVSCQFGCNLLFLSVCSLPPQLPPSHTLSVLNHYFHAIKKRHSKSAGRWKGVLRGWEQGQSIRIAYSIYSAFISSFVLSLGILHLRPMPCFEKLRHI